MNKINDTEAKNPNIGGNIFTKSKIELRNPFNWETSIPFITPLELSFKFDLSKIFKYWATYRKQLIPKKTIDIANPFFLKYIKIESLWKWTKKHNYKKLNITITLLNIL